MLEEPEFYVQIGWNGRILAENAVEANYADGAILSPADYTPEQNKAIATTISDNGGSVLFDPQFYYPRTTRSLLFEYDYFKDYAGEDFTTQTFIDEDSEEFCKSVMELQDELSTSAYIAPARFAASLSTPSIDAWKVITDVFLKVVGNDGRDIPVLASLPLDGRPLVDKTERNRLLNHVTGLGVDGFYISVRFGGYEAYPLTGSSSVFSVLHLLNSLATNEFNVLVGHTHHVSHLYFGVGAMGFASGHYKNLRTFDTVRWDPDEDREGGRHVVNYYSDAILNDLRVDQDLDLLYQAGDEVMEKIHMESPFDEPLFSGQVPSRVGWSLRPGSWDHYIWSCNQIAQKYRAIDAEDRFEAARDRVKKAHELYKELKSQIGFLSEPEEAIYGDWIAALTTLENLQES